MREVTAGRTLVKSPPELWAVCSNADALGQHLEAFGEIRITRLEPETTVAWEGERASGTVRIEPSGWGTKVTVTAAATESVAVPESSVTDPVTEAPVSVVPEPQPLSSEPEPRLPEPDQAPPEPAQAAAEPSHRPRFLARLFGGSHAPAPQPLVPQAVVSEQAAVTAAMPTQPAASPPAVIAVAEPVLEPAPVASVEPLEPADAAAVLEAALDRLGQAHRRPFSR